MKEQTDLTTSERYTPTAEIAVVVDEFSVRLEKVYRKNRTARNEVRNYRSVRATGARGRDRAARYLFFWPLKKHEQLNVLIPDIAINILFQNLFVYKIRVAVRC